MKKKQPEVKIFLGEMILGDREMLQGISTRSEMSLGTGDLGEEDE